MHSTSDSYGRRTGKKTISTRVEPEMREFLDRVTDRRDMTLAELLRHLCRLYEASERGELRCGNAECSEPIEL